jgi:hypothetical protein
LTQVSHEKSLKANEILNNTLPSLPPVKTAKIDKNTGTNIYPSLSDNQHKRPMKTEQFTQQYIFEMVTVKILLLLLERTLICCTSGARSARSKVWGRSADYPCQVTKTTHTDLAGTPQD